MEQLKKTFYFMALSVIMAFCLSLSAKAIAVPPQAESPSGLSFQQIKMTGDEYVVLHNNSDLDITDLSKYNLKIYSSTNPTATSSSTLQTLPAVRLMQGDTVLLSSTVRPTCGASIAGKLNGSLVDAGGTVQLLHIAAPNSGTTPLIVDSVSWSSSTNGHITMVPSSSKAPQAAYYRYQKADDSYGWQLTTIDLFNNCTLQVQIGSEAKPVEYASDITGTEANQPQLNITISDTTPEPVVQKPDEIYPIITELLPNPIGSGNDATQEYIELYNPGDKDFDLDGFSLQSGITTLRKYNFDDETVIAAKSYKVFYASTTQLSLSNSSSQAKLIDSFGKVIAETAVYQTAKDGQVWMVADGVWQWSVSPTPGQTNIVMPPPALPVKATSSATPKAAKPKAVNTKAPKAAKPAKPAKVKKEKTPKPTKISTKPAATSIASRPIQPKTIALVASIALLYGLYEYRADLANGYRKCRSYFGAWRQYWPNFKGRGSNRAGK